MHRTATRSLKDVPVDPEHQSSSDEPLTLSALLEERFMRGSTVLDGGTALGAHVQWVRPLQDALLDGDRLDQVAVAGFQEDFDPETVLALSRRGAAALLIRDGSPERWSAHPVPTGLPVIALPPQARPDLVARHVARLSLAHESHVLRYAQQVHSALAVLLHRGSGVDAICDLMERLTGCAVAVVDSGMHLLAFAQGRRTWLDPTSLGASSRDLLQRLSAEPAGARGTHEPWVLTPEIKDRPVTVVVGAIEVADEAEGWILLVNDSPDVPAHDIAEYRVVVEQASSIVGTELLRVRGIERAEERARGNFVHALLHGRFSNHADLVGRAAHHAFPVDGRFGVVVVQARGLIAEDDSPHRLAAMAREASRLQGSPDRRTMAAVVGDVLAVIRELAPSTRTGTDVGAKELTAFSAALARRLQSQTDRRVLVSYGRPCVGAEAIVGSYREARIALGLVSQLGLESPSGFSDLRVYSTLLGLSQTPSGRELTAELLDPLRSAQGDLESAVRAYVESGGNLNQAARNLSIHRNTMLYKLERASKALDWDLREPEAQFAVWLALKLDVLSRTADIVHRDLDAG